MRARLAGMAAALSALVPGVSASAARDAWVRVAREGDTTLSYNRATLKREGQRVRFTLRVLVGGTAPHTQIAEQVMDCAKQTAAILSVQEFGAGSEPLRSVSVPADLVRPDPLFAGDEMATLYRLLCPTGAPLPKRQSAPPPVQVLPKAQ